MSHYQTFFKNPDTARDKNPFGKSFCAAQDDLQSLESAAYPQTRGMLLKDRVERSLPATSSREENSKTSLGHHEPSLSSDLPFQELSIMNLMKGNFSYSNLTPGLRHLDNFSTSIQGQHHKDERPLSKIINFLSLVQKPE